MTRSEEVLSYWFGSSSGPPTPEQTQLWFGGGEAVDRAIRERFGEDVERARQGALADWAESARGRLALIILIDQFSRNLYRGSAEAFSKDPAALELTLAGLENGHYAALAPYEQMFFLLPLEHAEDLVLQDRALELFEAWAQRLPPELQAMGQGTLGFARMHRDVIARFGRFPTRNQALGRASTPEEDAHVREAKAAGRPV
jgi:uncharacterized protein (DUF924 family)